MELPTIGVDGERVALDRLGENRVLQELLGRVGSRENRGPQDQQRLVNHRTSSNTPANR